MEEGRQEDVRMRERNWRRGTARKLCVALQVVSMMVVFPM